MDTPAPTTAPYDEMYTADGQVRPPYAVYSDWLIREPADALRQKRAEADSLFHRVGITFAVYGEQDGNERLIPFDIVPRILSADEWRKLAAGLRQRVQALNAFVADIYHGQDILRAGVISSEQIFCNNQYRPEMQGLDVPGGIYAHIAGIDVVRAGQGEFYVLEDNLRVPSGVSYMLEDRKMMMRLFPELFALNRVAPVEHYPDRLLENLASAAPAGVAEPVVVVLTPGAHNSAYFEHAFLAQQMGVELVEGAGPVRARRLRLHAHHPGPETRRRDLPAHRRRFPRPAGVSLGFGARRTRVDVRLPRRARDGGQCDRHRHRRRQVHLSLRAGHGALLPR